MRPGGDAPEEISAREHAALLRDALLARADAEAAEVRAHAAREEAERAREEAELGRARLAVLTEAGRQMAQSIDWQSTVRAIVRSAVPAVADWTSLTMLEPTGELRTVAVAHRDPERERLAWQLLERHPPDRSADAGVAAVIRTGELEMVEDLAVETITAAAQDAEHLRLLENLNLHHYVIAPLSTPAGVIGALTFVLGDSRRRFEPGDVGLITSLAARAALHIQNSRLFTERLRIAEALQVGLRPPALPSVDGVELAAGFRPASDELEVGGDFYDVFPADDGTCTLIIGDVSGKGAEAAAVTALARHTLRTASLLVSDPAAVLGLLNRALHADPTANFCTVFYARVRLRERPAPVPLCQRWPRFAAGAAARRDDRGDRWGSRAGLGPFANAEYQEATLTLEAGDLLLMYTDGLIEVRRRDVARGERELRAALAASGGRSADEVVETVMGKAVELLGGRSRDDMALLAAKTRAAPVKDN